MDGCRKSEVVVIDAKTMAPDPVAIVRLPRRVPHGFHALFISQVCNIWLYFNLTFLLDRHHDYNSIF